MLSRAYAPKLYGCTLQSLLELVVSTARPPQPERIWFAVTSRFVKLDGLDEESGMSAEPKGVSSVRVPVPVT